VWAGLALGDLDSGLEGAGWVLKMQNGMIRHGPCMMGRWQLPQCWRWVRIQLGTDRGRMWMGLLWMSLFAEYYQQQWPGI